MNSIVFFGRVIMGAVASAALQFWVEGLMVTFAGETLRVQCSWSSVKTTVPAVPIRPGVRTFVCFGQKLYEII